VVDVGCDDWRGKLASKWLVAVGVFWSSKYYRGVAGVEMAKFHRIKDNRMGGDSVFGVSNKLAAAGCVELDCGSENGVEIVVRAEGGSVWPLGGKTSINGLFLVVAVVTDIGSRSGFPHNKPVSVFVGETEIGIGS